MKGLAKAHKIIAIVLNAIFLVGLIFFLISFPPDPRTLNDWSGFISMFALAPMTIIAIALTFGKKLQVIRLVLRIVAIIVNALFFIILIYVTAIGNVHIEGLAMWIIGIVGYGLPVVNIAALVLAK
jgi:hypothetical protein